MKKNTKGPKKAGKTRSQTDPPAERSLGQVLSNLDYRRFFYTVFAAFFALMVGGPVLGLPGFKYWIVL